MPIAGQEEREEYRGRAQSSAVHTRKVMAETSVFEDRLEDKQQEIIDAAEKKKNEEANKDFWGWLTTIGTTVGCIAMTGGSLTAQCIALGTLGGGAARTITDLTSYAEGSPEGIDVSGAKYNKGVWDDVESDIDSQLQALEDFDDNVWKKDVLAQVSDTWTAVQWGKSLDTLGIFAEDSVIPIPEIPDIDTDINFSSSYTPPSLGT